MLADYLEKVPMTRTQKAYAGVPLANSAARGTILEHAAKRVIEKMTGKTATLPEDGMCVNGRKRGRNAMEHDFEIDQQRVEVKSAQLAWDGRRWRTVWNDVKSNKHDVLLLVMYSPFGLHIFKHDGTFGVCTHGQQQNATGGGRVQAVGPRNQEAITEAHAVIIDKLQHMLYACLEFADIVDLIQPTKTHEAYAGVALAELSNPARGVILEHVARLVMEEMTGQNATLPADGKCINGSKRGRGNKTNDFNMQQRRVEVKSAQVKWDDSQRRWHAEWKAIKSSMYEVLLLVLYSPFGVHIFLHDGKFGVSTSGIQQYASGGSVNVCARCNQDSIFEAHKVIVDKLGHMLYATLSFGQH